MTNRYMKFAVQLVATVLVAIVPFVVDNRLDTGEIINIVIIGLGAFAVLGAGNLPSGVWAYAKLWVSAATAVATLLVSFIDNGLQPGEIVQLAIAALAAFGVYAVPGPRVKEAVNSAAPHTATGTEYL